MQMQASGRTWAVATPHALATEAASIAFERGGNALDAALAAATTLAVVYPHMCGVGGDLFALVQHPAGDVVAVNASGRAPAGADLDAATRAGGGHMPEHGPHSVTVPGAVSGWEALHRQGASLGWAEAFTAAIAYAHGGVKVAPSLGRTLAEELRLRSDPGLAEVFYAEGDPAQPEATVRQPALGATLQAIAEQGPSVWYGGELGTRYANGLRELGVPIDVADMAGHRADLGTPLRSKHDDVDVLVHPPNSQGFVLLEALSVIERLGLDPDPTGSDAGTIAHVLRAAARDRDRHLADPDRMRVHASTLLDDGHLGAVADEVRSGVTGPPPAHTPRRGGDTIALVTADAEGRGVSLIQSLYDGFGSGLLEPSTGVVAQNRGACFTLEPGHPNLFAAGARPAHTLMPVAVQRAGRFEAVAGTMGGSAQPQIMTMALLRAFRLGMSPAEAISAPRWLVGGMSPEGPEPLVIAEADVPEQAIRSLESAGYRVSRVDAHDDSVGHAHMIRTTGDGSDAGSDPRADGGAMAT
jgi:gamma-glutamyltranspeptidase